VSLIYKLDWEWILLPTKNEDSPGQTLKSYRRDITECITTPHSGVGTIKISTASHIITIKNQSSLCNGSTEVTISVKPEIQIQQQPRP